MKMMIWKELKENILWAVAGMLAMGLSCAWLISQNTDSSSRWLNLWVNSLTQPFTLLSPLLATCLGFLQTARELKPDQRAFLLHRPLSRSAIFAGKVLAGLCFYLFATALPLLAAGLWLGVPGRVPGPFDWRLLLPETFAILAGISFYFAAIITATRQASWYGSKALALPAAVSGAFLANSLPHVWMALLCTLIFAAVLGLAAWGSFVSGGALTLQHKVARAGLGTTLYLGIGTVTVVIMTVFSALLMNQEDVYTYSQHEIDIQSRTVRVTRKDNLIETVTDTSGKPLKPPGGRARWAEQDFLTRAALVPRLTNEDFREPRHLFPPVFGYGGGSSRLLWYYLPEQGLMAGYSRSTNKLEGYIGSSGHAPVGSPLPNPFPGTYQNNIDQYFGSDILRFSDAVYLFNEEEQRAVRIYKTKAPGEIQGVVRLNQGYYPATGPMRLVVATKSKLVYLTAAGRELFSTPIEYPRSRFPYMQLALNSKDGRNFIWYQPPYAGPDRKQNPILVTELTPRGSVAKHYTLPPFLEPVSEEMPGITYAVALLVPPAATTALGCFAVVGQPLGVKSAMDMMKQMRLEPTPVLIYTGLSLLGGFISVLLAAHICKRCQFARGARVAWSIGAFFLGLFGVLLLLALWEWPARETCAQCGKPRVVTKEKCEHCGAPWPAAERDGTEIFEESQIRRLDAVRVEATQHAEFA